MRWKTRNVLYLALTLFIFYIFFIYKKKYHVNFEGTIQNSNPIHVWEYVADFSNMKKLNPTMCVKTIIIHKILPFIFFYYLTKYLFLTLEKSLM